MGSGLPTHPPSAVDRHAAQQYAGAHVAVVVARMGRGRRARSTAQRQPLTSITAMEWQ